jgi:uncharacterized protein YndB with AHSA1/START domain
VDEHHEEREHGAVVRLVDGHARRGEHDQNKKLFEQDGPESVAHIDACEPPRRLALSTQGTWGVKVEITLTQTGSVTELRFVHHLTDRKLARDFGPGWEYYLDNLVAARAGAKLPTFDEYHPSMQAHYTDP